MIRDKYNLDSRMNESFRKFYEKMRKEPPGIYTLYICDKKKSRSKKQRGYYFAVIVAMISEHTGYTPKETNIILKHKFNLKEVQQGDGSWIKYGDSIEEESPARVEQIQEAIRNWAAQEMNLIIPEPEQISDEKLIEIETGNYNTA